MRRRSNFGMTARTMFIIVACWITFFLVAGYVVKCAAIRDAEEMRKWKIYQ